MASNLRKKNEEQRRITARKRSEAELAKYRDHLEQIVQERTSELEKANSDLKQEVTERKKEEENSPCEPGTSGRQRVQQAMVRATDEQRLLTDVCRIIVNRPVTVWHGWARSSMTKPSR